MISARSLVALLLVGLVGLSYQQAAGPVSDPTTCTNYYNDFTKQCGIDLNSAAPCSTQAAGCFSGNTQTYNDYVCCHYDYAANHPGSNQRRKLAQGAGCAQSFTGNAINYETQNIRSIVMYCRGQGYTTNYTAIFGDVAALENIPVPTSVSDRTPSAPKASGSMLGVSSLLGSMLLAAVVLLL